MFFALRLPGAATWIALVSVTAAAHTLLWISSRKALSPPVGGEPRPPAGR
jgi:hypothetical protein